MQQDIKKRKSNLKSTLISCIIELVALVAVSLYFLSKGSVIEYATWQKILMFGGCGIWLVFILISFAKSVNSLVDLKKNKGLYIFSSEPGSGMSVHMESVDDGNNEHSSD